jgi:hypothetical protein
MRGCWLYALETISHLINAAGSIVEEHSFRSLPWAKAKGAVKPKMSGI